MDTLKTYREIVEKVCYEYAALSYAHGDIQREVIIDREGDRYLLMAMGWDGAKRIHGCIFQIDIVNGKLWIQRDGIEHGIADDLERYGVPKEHIVLGFYAPDIRQHTEYAVA